jgi:hypothetical protein
MDKASLRASIFDDFFMLLVLNLATRSATPTLSMGGDWASVAPRLMLLFGQEF